MQEFKGTPGPWEIVNGGDIFGPLGGESGDGLACDETDGWQVAEVGHYSAFVDGELVEQGAAVRKANQALLLAAPALLKALQEVVAISDRKHEAWDRAHAAIAKALNTDTTER